MSQLCLLDLTAWEDTLLALSNEKHLRANCVNLRAVVIPSVPCTHVWLQAVSPAVQAWTMCDNKERENKHKWQHTANISQRRWGGRVGVQKRWIHTRKWQSSLTAAQKGKKQCPLQGWETLLSVWMHIYGSLAADALLQNCRRGIPPSPLAWSFMKEHTEVTSEGPTHQGGK